MSCKSKKIIRITKFFLIFFLYLHFTYICAIIMDKKKIILLGLLAGLTLVGCASMGEKLIHYNTNYKLGKINKIIFFQPSVFPEVEEIKHPTSQAFFGSVTEHTRLNSNIKAVPMDHALNYENIDIQYIKDVAQNNNAEAVIVPHIKYFKVGFGKYVFSNQVLVKLKLYDNEGNFLMETQYDTYKGKARLIGKAENSIKIGTKQALKLLVKELKRKKMI